MPTHRDTDQREADASDRAFARAERKQGEGQHLEPSATVREWIDLKFASMRSEMRLLFVIAVAGNQVLSHVSIGTTVGYIGGTITLLGVAVKVALFR